jgi:hypothetical protein
MNQLPTVTIDGQPIKDEKTGHKKHLIWVNGYGVLLQPSLFRMFTLLALARKGPDGGWLRTDDCGIRAGSVAGIIYKIRMSIQAQLTHVLIPVPLCYWAVVENDSRGSYRLATNRNRVEFCNVKAMIAFDDAMIAKLFRKG